MRRELPSGTITFLFTDIEGSTRLLDELGDDYAAALAKHRRSLRAAVARHGGAEVDTQGDAFSFAFPRARDAIARDWAQSRAMHEPSPVYTNRLQCEECASVSREAERGWTAHLTDDEPEEVVVFCPECDEREFGGRRL